MCLVSRGSEEGSTIELDPGNLQLVANKAVSFRLYSSRTRTEDKPGDVVEFPRESPDGEPHLHAPLNAVLRFGKAGERLVPVKLGAKLTEVGTLEIWTDSKVSEHRWRLQFELRKAAAEHAPSRPAAVVSEEARRRWLCFPPRFRRYDRARAVARETRAGAGPGPQLVARIGDPETRGQHARLAEGRRRSPAHELRWLNLCGFCLRPGFGFPATNFASSRPRRVCRGLAVREPSPE
jgi:hypothetical protein